MTTPDLVWFPDEAIAAGCSVVRVAGWEARRNKRQLDVRWMLLHHTASVPWSDDAANINVVVNGNSVAPGPIASNLVLRDGRLAMIAAGASNNAGAGTLPDGGTDGNAQWGWEAVNAGAAMRFVAPNQVVYGGHTYTLSASQLATWNRRVAAGELVQDPAGLWWEVWRESMLVGWATGVAVALHHLGLGLDRLCTHQQYAPTRKIDPAGPWFDAPTKPLTAAQFKARFAGLVALIHDRLYAPTKPPVTPPTEEIDMQPELIRFLGFWNEVLDTSAGPLHGTNEQVPKWRTLYGVPVTDGPNTDGKGALVIDPRKQHAKYLSTLRRLCLSKDDLTPSGELTPGEVLALGS
jgi:hypothetical protein